MSIKQLGVNDEDEDQPCMWIIKLLKYIFFIFAINENWAHYYGRTRVKTYLSIITGKG